MQEAAATKISGHILPAKSPQELKDLELQTRSLSPKASQQAFGTDLVVASLRQPGKSMVLALLHSIDLPG